MFLTSEKFTPQKGACFKIVPPASKTTATPLPPLPRGDVIDHRSLRRRHVSASQGVSCIANSRSYRGGGPRGRNPD